MARKSTTNPVNETGFDLEAVPEEHRAQVESMIPPAYKAENYIHRTIAGTHDFDLYDMARKTRHNLIFRGPTGAGKTTSAVAYAAHYQIPYCSVEVNGAMDFGSVFGSMQVGKDGLPVYRYGELSLVAKYGGVGDISECNFGPARFNAAVHGLLDMRQSLYLADIGERIPKHEACVVVSSYNPGYTGTVKLNEAFLNRFALPFEWGYDPAVEEALIAPYSPTLLETVRRLRNEDSVRTDIGTNAMEEFVLFATHDLGSVELASEAFVGRFPDAEQLSVRKIFEAHRLSIAAELSGTQVPDTTELTADEDNLTDPAA